VLQRPPIGIPPNTVALHLPVKLGILVTAQRLYPFLDDLRRVDHDVSLLTVEPALRVLVAVAHDANFVVDGHELDMAVALLDCRVERDALVFADVPEDVQVLRTRNGVERFVEPCDYLLVRSALEWDHLALVVEAEIEPKVDVDAAFTCVDNGRNNGTRVERGRLTKQSVG